MKLLSIIFGTAIVLAVFASQTTAEPQPDPLFMEGLQALQTANQGLWQTAQNVATNLKQNALNVATNIKGNLNTVGKSFVGKVQTFKNGIKELLMGPTKPSA